MKSMAHMVSNNDGWKLALKQSINETVFNPQLRPVALIPGYGMNAFIFGYHPTGDSIETYLTDRGFEVWSVNLREQGESVQESARWSKGNKTYGMKELALIDLPAGFDYILNATKSQASLIDVIGCSLGGTLLFIYAALAGTDLLGSIVSMGAPLRWVEVNPLFKIVLCSPKLVGMVPFAYTRSLIRWTLPMVKYVPWIISMYMHPAIVDLSRPDLLTKTVEDPIPAINREIAEWIQAKDLFFNELNITDQLSSMSNPLLCVVANADGIVPERTARFPGEIVASKINDVLLVGNESIRFAHADLFISRYAQDMVFKPLTEWLLHTPSTLHL